MARKRKLEKDIRCPLEYGLDVFGGKWKSRIPCVLADGRLRHGEIRNEMTDVTDTYLANALKELTESGLVERIQFNEIPPHVEYPLTEKGGSVISVLQHICQWAGIFCKGESPVQLYKCQRCDFRP